MSIKAIRGAVCLTADDSAEMADAVTELLGEMLNRNGLTATDIVSVLFTATPDIHSGFPATAARSVGLADVPLICAQEIDVTGAMPLVIRTMMHAEMNISRADVKHVYLRGAEVLRQDIAQ